MTYHSPRIYTYKITFEEVPYYYYGSKKEEYYNQKYWGSPVTNKWCWELYTPKKQILEFFDYTDEGYEECRKVENRLIKPVFNTDKWCLNESCSGFMSLDICSKAGKKGSKKQKELRLGIHGKTKEEMVENGRKCGTKLKELGLGIFSLTPEEKRENAVKGGKIGGPKLKELGLGIFSLTPEEHRENTVKGGKRGAQKQKELGIGIYGLTREQRSENAKRHNSTRWKCDVTGHISTYNSLSRFQNNRGIDNSKRTRVS